MPVLIVDNLSKTFKSQKASPAPALNGVTLSVDQNELLVVVGPSGSGKTTLLRLIAGLEQPSHGTISLAGRSLQDVPPKDRDIAMVFQTHALFPHMTAFENMSFGLKLRKCPAAEIQKRVGEAAQILCISDKLQRRPDELSGGEAQRVALGRALVRQPKLFLLDEPLSHLDAPTRVQLRRDIAKLQKHLGTPMIYVTHDQNEALKLGHRIAVLRHGELQQIGTPAEIRQKPANSFVADFFQEERTL